LMSANQNGTYGPPFEAEKKKLKRNCPHCGREVAMTDKTCPNCGKPL